MKVKKGLVILGVLLLGFSALSLAFVSRYGKNFGIYLTAPTPVEYVNDALLFMGNGMYATGEKWQAAKAAAREKAASCISYEETYDIIQETLKVAGGKHSAILSPSSVAKSVAEQQLPEVSFDEGVLYVKLPPFEGTSNLQQQYVDAVLGPVEHHASEIRGLILDLRDNTGGAMGPMIAAVSPFLPDGVVLQFKTGSRYQDVTLTAGTVSDGGPAAHVTFTGKICVPVAVLQNKWTASSGEATLICFKGLDRVRFFGEGTAGYASGNVVRHMYDGAHVLLTVSCDVDRDGNLYCDDPIEPDVVTDDPLDDARSWIDQESIFTLLLRG